MQPEEQARLAIDKKLEQSGWTILMHFKVVDLNRYNKRKLLEVSLMNTIDFQKTYVNHYLLLEKDFEETKQYVTIARQDLLVMIKCL